MGHRKLVVLLSCTVAAVCAATGARGQTPAWTQPSTPGPTPRHSHAMAYDSGRSRVVMFGGYFGFPNLGDTWEWDGTSWAKRSTAGPTPRAFHAMAYDSTRGRVVLFGGHVTSGADLGDTWEWDGSSWNKSSTTGPTPREFHAMAYDSARGRVVLFGGYYNDGSGHYLADIWEWDGASWTQSVPAGPSPTPRRFHAIAYDSARGRVVLFGGYAGFGYYLGDTWEWYGTTWSQLSTTGPVARAHHAMAYDPACGRVVLFGGAYTDGSDHYLGDTWEWDGASWMQRSITGPMPRFGHAMTYDSVRGRLVLFGGSDGSLLSDTWEYRGIRLGDMNTDGKLDALDLQPFVNALLATPTDPAAVYIADFDNSGAIDLPDIDLFVTALLASAP